MKWACYVRVPDVGWIVDTCAGGNYTFDVDEAKWWDSKEDMQTELEACDLIYSDKYAIDIDDGTWSPPIQLYSALRVR